MWKALQGARIHGHPQLRPSISSSVLVSISENFHWGQAVCQSSAEAPVWTGWFRIIIWAMKLLHLWVGLERSILNIEAHVVPKKSLTPYFMVHLSQHLTYDIELSQVTTILCCRTLASTETTKAGTSINLVDTFKGKTRELVSWVKWLLNTTQMFT